MSRTRVKVVSVWSVLVSVVFLCAPLKAQFLFIRGDANGTGNADISDAITIFSFLFLGEKLDCRDSGDVNDDGQLDISDGIRLLSFLFLGADQPPPPFPDCGADPSPDPIACEVDTGCRPPAVPLVVTGTVFLDTGGSVEAATVFGSAMDESVDALQRIRQAGQAHKLVADRQDETTTGADGSFRLELFAEELPARVLVEVSFAAVSLPVVESARWARAEGEELDVGTIVISDPGDAELALSNGVAESADGSVRIDAVPEQVARLFGRSYDPDEVPEAYPGEFGEDPSIRLDPAVFVWVEALAADGSPVDQLSEPVTVQVRVPRSQWDDLADIDAGTDRIDIPLFHYNEDVDAWEQEGTGWLEDGDGNVLREEAETLILDDIFPGDVFLAFTVQHFSWRSGCVCHVGPWTLCRLPKSKRKNECFQKAAKMAATIARSRKGLTAYRKVHSLLENDPLTKVARSLAERKGPEVRAVRDLKKGRGKVVGDRWVPEGTPGDPLWARYDGDSGGREDELLLNVNLWDQCTGGDAQKKKIITQMVFALLHETSHWMDDVKKYPKTGSGAEGVYYDTPGEEGNQLERDIFGGRILVGDNGQLEFDPNGPQPPRPVTDTDINGWLNPNNWPAPGGGGNEQGGQGGGSPLSVVISSSADTYDLGQEIPVEVMYQNNSGIPVEVLQLVELEGNPLHFLITNRTTGQRVPFVGGEVELYFDGDDRSTLTPGGTLTLAANLLKDPMTGGVLYDLSQSGKFDLFAVHEEWGEIPATTSNTITFRIREGTGGTMSGTVTDFDEHLAVAGATVGLMLNATPLTQAAVTGAGGEYSFDDLIPGVYTVRASAAGFLTKSEEDVEVVAGQERTVDFGLTRFTTVLPRLQQAIAIGGRHSCELSASGRVRCWGANAYGQLGDGTTTLRATPVGVLDAPGGAPLGGVVELAAGWQHTCALTTAGTVKCWGWNGVGQLGDGGPGIHHSTPVDVLEEPAGLPLIGVVAVAAGGGHTCALLTDGTVKCWGVNGVGQLGDGTTETRSTPVHVLEAPDGPPLSGVVAIAAGFEHTCALLSDGTVRSWGINVVGQLGDGTESFDNPIPVAVLDRSTGEPLTGVIAITAGDAHTCALLADGTVKCWGSNFDGQLGIGPTDDYHTAPEDVLGEAGGAPLSGIVAISAGTTHTCALTTDGQVKAWGANHQGQLGDGTTDFSTTPVDVLEAPDGRPLSGVVAISTSTGGEHTCALIEDGEIKCWGDSFYGQLGDGSVAFSSPEPVEVVAEPDGPPLGDVSDIAAGGGHTCARTAAGGAKCWGSNWWGQLGDGTTDSRSTPVDVLEEPNGSPLSGVTMLAAGSTHTCALTTDGGVKCWGSNGFNQLGDGTSTSHSTPVDVREAPDGSALAGVEAIVAGNWHTCALLADGTVKCWGRNAWGQLGEGTTTPHETPVHVLEAPDGSPLTGVVAIVAGYGHTCALTGDGEVKCWGLNGNGQLGDGTTTRRTTPVAVLEEAGGEPLRGIVAIAAGRHFTCALTTAGTVHCWGTNDNGQLGDGTTFDSPSPTVVLEELGGMLLDGVVAIAASSGEVAGNRLYGRGHACALTADGQVKCWGDNDYGQLGDGTTTDWRLTPVDVMQTPELALQDVVKVVTGAKHTCALTKTGNVKCWGAKENGQLGVGPVTFFRTIPVAVVTP